MLDDFWLLTVYINCDNEDKMGVKPIDILNQDDFF